MRMQLLTSVIVAAATCWVQPAVQAAVVYQDSFAVNNAGGDTARDPGDPLAGTITEIGGGTWATSAGINLGQVGATTDGYVYATSATSTSLYAALPLSLNAGDVVTVEARIKSFNSAGTDNWTAIGYASASGSLLANGKTWMIVRQDTTRTDEIVVLGALGGTSAGNTLIKTATPGSPDADGYTVVLLTYDSGANTVTAVINGQTLLSDVANLGTPTITHVGFQHFRNTVEGAVDDFKVTVTPAPEPAAMALFALGGLLVFRRGAHDD
ncbi:MAG: hypothetical protein IT445_15885 [Phycisphaeraceae bacterium]|nr:hypothetical protein [Phycisphaeraceae bacterium]